MTRVSTLGEYLRYRSALPPRLSEFAILVTAAHWRQSFEWDIHAPAALKAGIARPVIDALWRGEPLHDLEPDVQAVYDVCTELHQTRRLSDRTRAHAESVLSARQVMDTIGICGYYALLAMVLNARAGGII
jgi:4-carboxymuconolactone decarboxylase